MNEDPLVVFLVILIASFVLLVVRLYLVSRWLDKARPIYYEQMTLSELVDPGTPLFSAIHFDRLLFSSRIWTYQQAFPEYQE